MSIETAIVFTGNPILRTTHARSFIFHPAFKGLPDTIKKVMKFLCDL